MESESSPESFAARFPRVFPLPFRVVVLISAGILAWASNLHGLQHAGIIVSDGLEPGRVLESPSYSSIYLLHIIFSFWVFASWALFRSLTNADADNLDLYRSVPAICLVVILAALFAPFNVLCLRERRQFLRAIRRCLTPWGKPSFGDVILADILTSFAKVIGDIWISLFMLLPSGSLVRVHLVSQQSDLSVPLIMSIPYLIRFRQCVSEYFESTERPRSSLYNAFKYLTAFPVIFLSSMQRQVAADVASGDPSVSRSVWFGEHPLFRLWLLSVVVNSIYSFWWDTSTDWGLNLLPPHSTHIPDEGENRLHKTRARYPMLRADLVLFSSPFPYTIATILNLVLRLTWSLKLSPHLHDVADLEYGVFLLEALEVFRRWIWVYFRVEWEYIKRKHPHTFSRRHPIQQEELDSIRLM